MSPLPGSPMGPPWREMPISRAFLYIDFRVPSKGAPPPWSPHRASTVRNAPFPEPSFICLSKSMVNEPTPGSQLVPYGERCPFPDPSSTHPLIKTKSHLSLKVSCSTNEVPKERDALSPEPMVYSFIYVCQSPQKRAFPQNGENQSPSTEPHVDGRPT